MPTQVQYAVMAAASYISTRLEINRFSVPEGWSEDTVGRVREDSGFEATRFSKGSEIVISFAGTYPGKLRGPTNSVGLPVDFVADFKLADGAGSDQLLEAAQNQWGQSRLIRPRSQGCTHPTPGQKMGSESFFDNFMMKNAIHEYIEKRFRRGKKDGGKTAIQSG